MPSADGESAREESVTDIYEKANPEAAHLPGFGSTPVHIAGPFPLEMPSRLETAEELATRDPDEVISIPMVVTVQKPSLMPYFSARKAQGSVRRTVVMRPMKRGRYAAHYAKSQSGEYVGTGSPAYDAGLVYVPNKDHSRESIDEWKARAESEVAAKRLQVEARAAELEQQALTLIERETALSRQVERIKEVGTAIAAERKAVIDARQAW